VICDEHIVKPHGVQHKSRAIAGRTAWNHCEFR